MNQLEQTLLDRYNCNSLDDLILYIDNLRYTNEIGKGFIPISETLPDCVIISDEAGKICYANSVAHELFIYDNLIDINILSLISNKYEKKHTFETQQSILSEFNSNKIAYAYALKSDGTEFPMSISLTRYRKNGEYNFIAIIRDVTRTLKDIEVFKLILKDIPIMVAIFKERLEFEYTNDKFIEVLGIESNELSYHIENIMMDESEVSNGIIHMYENNQEWKRFKLKAANGNIIDSTWYNVKYEDKWIAFGIQLSELPSNENLLRRALDVVIEGKRSNG